MDFEKAQKFTARVSDSYYLNDNQSFMLVKLEFTEPNQMHFQAGQYVSLKVNETGERRSYSIVSTPDVSHGIELCAEIIPSGKGSDFLKSLQPGDTVEVLGPLGRFVVDPSMIGDRKLLFVATGSGIAPITSMITDLLVNKREMRPMRLHWGMRDESHMFWFDNFQRLAEEHPNFVFDQVLSRPSESWELCTGHVQDCITRDFSHADMKEWEIYACGSPRMVEETSSLFTRMGVRLEQYHHEKFT